MRNTALLTLTIFSLLLLTSCERPIFEKEVAKIVQKAAVEGVKVEIKRVMLLNIDEDKDKEICAFYSFQKGEYPEKYLSLINRENGKYKEIWAEGIYLLDEKDIKILDLDKDGINEIFYVNKSEGTGFSSYYLSVYSPKYQELFSLSLGFKHSAAEPVPKVETSSNLDLEKFKVVKNFLDTIKKDYGYTDVQELSKRQDDPELAAYFWKVDNGYIKEGKIKIRKYRGKPSLSGSILDTLEREDFIWYACFKGGVYKYNKKEDTFFVIYFPENVYYWPTVLRKKGNFLYIGTRGEGLIIYHIENQILKQFVNKEIEDIDKITIDNNEMLINESYKVPLDKLEF